MNHRVLICILAALSMVGAFSIDSYLPALPAIARDFGTTLPAAQQTLTVYLFAYAFMSLFYGTLSDSFGRKPVIILSLGLYVVSTAAGGCATSLGALLGFRMLQGLSAGAGSVIGRAIVGDLLSGAEAQRTLSYIAVVFGLAPAVAPVVGGWLQASCGWRSIFFFVAIFALLLLGACLRWLPESLPKEQRHPFHFKPIIVRYWRIGGHAPFIFQSLGAVLSFMGILVYVSAAPAFVMNILHLTVKDFGWLFLPLIGGLTLGSAMSGRLSHRFSPAQLIRFGYGVMVASALVNVAYTALFTASVPWAVLPLFVYGIGTALATPAMTIISLEMFPEARGMSSSLQGFIFMIVFAIGTGVICPLLFGSAFHLACGGAVGLALSILCWWAGTRPLSPEPVNLRSGHTHTGKYEATNSA